MLPVVYEAGKIKVGKKKTCQHKGIKHISFLFAKEMHMLLCISLSLFIPLRLPAQLLDL